MTTLSQQLEHAAGRTAEETGHELFSALLARAGVREAVTAPPERYVAVEGGSVVAG
jgi:hypothetical protein